MILRSSRHLAVLEELTVSWRDIRDRGAGSRLALVQIPAGWGAPIVLDEFRQFVEEPDGPVTISISIGSIPTASRAIQAEALRDALTGLFAQSRTAELLDLDTATGKIQLGLGVGGLFASGLAMALPLLLGSLAATAAGNAWDISFAGQQGMVARAARAVAAVSARAPVAVTIDDADRLDPDLADVMIDNLVSRHDGRVMVMAVVGPQSQLAEGLRAEGRYGLLGRVQKVDADPQMNAQAREALVREMCPRLEDPAQ